MFIYRFTLIDLGMTFYKSYKDNKKCIHTTVHIKQIHFIKIKLVYPYGDNLFKNKICQTKKP